MANSVARQEMPRIDFESPNRFLNRELSWLEFNYRVLGEAENKIHPLLERVKFLSISASNLDEFYMVRVAGLIGQVSAGVDHPSVDGLIPSRQLIAIREKVLDLMGKQQSCWRAIKAELQSFGIYIV